MAREVLVAWAHAIRDPTVLQSDLPAMDWANEGDASLKTEVQRCNEFMRSGIAFNFMNMINHIKLVLKCQASVPTMQLQPLHCNAEC